jgi:transducin (beta)-like 1
MSDKPDDLKPRSYKWANETIHSNHINYLVWRYLQEAGFLMAATWLGREWHREPHKVMPFAKYVNQHQLVRMLQDALFYDDVRARGVRVSPPSAVIARRVFC